MTHENLWAPWRMAYLRELNRKAAQVTNLKPTDGREQQQRASFLAAYFKDPANDPTNLVVRRNEHGLVLLNRYPYANGHLIVALGEARPSLLDYTIEQREQFWKLIELATSLMQQTLNPQGINIGINQGEAAGAGVPEHLHAHLVPRWNGDTNFMAVAANVRVIPDALETMWKQYQDVAGSMPA